MILQVAGPGEPRQGALETALDTGADGEALATILTHKGLYQRQIEAADEEIDALVYELYGLTGEEIAIVEGRDH